MSEMAVRFHLSIEPGEPYIRIGGDDEGHLRVHASHVDFVMLAETLAFVLAATLEAPEVPVEKRTLCRGIVGAGA